MAEYLGVLRIEALVDTDSGELAQEIFEGLKGVELGITLTFANPEPRNVKVPPSKTITVKFSDVEVWGLRLEGTG